MKKLLTLLPLALAATACQQAAPPTQAVAAAPVALADTARPAPTSHTWPPLPALFAAGDTLTPPMREVVATNDLAQLWLNPAGSFGDSPTFEGFFGPDHYHFALVLTRVRRDSTDPALYQVVGKCRYYQSRTTRPFIGTLMVRQLQPFEYLPFRHYLGYNHSGTADSARAQLYTARAQLHWQEAPTANSGLFEGEALLDFYTLPGQPADYVTVTDREGNDDQLPTRGGRLLLRGQRRNLTTGQIKQFIVSPDVQAVAPHVFQDFMLDERMGEISPKYKHLGWEDAWRLDEWWAASPKPKLNL